MVLDGHAREILSIDFAPNGFQVATASGDDTVRVWDMRALRSISTIPAHRSSVADVRFFRAADEGAAARGSMPDEDKEANGDAKARGEMEARIRAEVEAKLKAEAEAKAAPKVEAGAESKP